MRRGLPRDRRGRRGERDGLVPARLRSAQPGRPGAGHRGRAGGSPARRAPGGDALQPGLRLRAHGPRRDRRGDAGAGDRGRLPRLRLDRLGRGPGGGASARQRSAAGALRLQGAEGPQRRRDALRADPAGGLRRRARVPRRRAVQRRAWTALGRVVAREPLRRRHASARMHRARARRAGARLVDAPDAPRARGPLEARSQAAPDRGREVPPGRLPRRQPPGRYVLGHVGLLLPEPHRARWSGVRGRPGPGDPQGQAAALRVRRERPRRARAARGRAGDPRPRSGGAGPRGRAGASF